MEGKFPEEMKCPICFDIPKKEIYQCKNGHLICHFCSASLKVCPQCRINYECPKIRSRGVENLLDMMKFICAFKSFGCTKTLSRKELQNHINNCAHGGEKINLCELLGLSCSFFVNSKRLPIAYEHFKSTHQLKMCNTLQALIRHRGLGSFQESPKTCFWTPVLFWNSNPETDAFLSLTFFNPEDSSVSFVCALLSKNRIAAEVFAKFVIKSPNSKETNDLVWLTPTVPLSQIERLVKQGFLRLPLSLLQRYATNDCLDVSCTIGDQKESEAKKGKKVNPMVISVGLLSSQMQPTTAIAEQSNEKAPPVACSSKSVEGSVDLREAAIYKLIWSDFIASCKICKRRINVNARYKCLMCPNFNVCFACLEKEEHTPGHIFALLENHKQHQRLMKSLVRDNDQWRPYFSESLEYPEDPPNMELITCKICQHDNLVMCFCLLCSPIFVCCQACFLAGTYHGCHPDDHFLVVATTDFDLIMMQAQLHSLNIQNKPSSEKPN